MNENTICFQTKLSALVAKELCGDPETVGALIERLTAALGLAIASASGGNAKTADTLLTGAEGYLAESVSENMKLAAFMNQVRGGRNG